MGAPSAWGLSDEQQLFIEKALRGENILVDACIGSGKTTAIQELCNRLPVTKRVLYLTYNRLLKLDAKAKIKKKNVTVTNYHGFAYMVLNRNGESAGISDLIQTFLAKKPPISAYDILILDEYQDIEQELAEMLFEEMTKREIVSFLAEQNPADLLCLGARTGIMPYIFNILEEKYPGEFNKKTVYATISDHDSMGKTEPTPETAIFTTYDSSKGLERKICVVFDFTESYWQTRLSKPQQSYAILRNIFCVAVSRGKNRIIFVKPDDAMLSEETLSKAAKTNQKFEDMDISEMFDFKYKEDVERCFSLLKFRKQKPDDPSLIHIKSSDDLIDLSPCIGIYQEAVFSILIRSMPRSS